MSISLPSFMLPLALDLSCLEHETHRPIPDLLESVRNYVYSLQVTACDQEPQSSSTVDQGMQLISDIRSVLASLEKLPTEQRSLHLPLWVKLIAHYHYLELLVQQRG